MTCYVGLDPSTKTGLVVLDSQGNIQKEIEIEKKGQDPVRMISLIEEIFCYLQSGDFVCVEGFGFASQSGFLLGGIGWGIRMKLFEAGIKYNEVAPAALKKFTGAGGKASKEILAVEVYKRWGFQSNSNNITDAYVLAQIARALHQPLKLTTFQQEVIKVIQSPPIKKSKKSK